MRIYPFGHHFGRRPVPLRQRLLAFEAVANRRERRFKGLIVAGTALLVATMLGVSPWGRYGVARSLTEARQLVRQILGLGRSRSDVDDDWRRYRELGIRESRRGLGQVYAEADPAMQRLMRYAGLDPEHGLLRWGNFDQTLLLPAKVFEADHEGRSYRLRPNTRSIWLRQLTLKSGVLMFFLVPDGPGLAEAIRGTTGIPVETSRQSTNSWGLRGPEPDANARMRGLVLGDSYMQGMFVGDDETPPESLRRYIEPRVGAKVSILNTGVLGYSPEQYYHSLLTFADRFRPHFVVVSVFTNDFGDLHEVATKGRGDWEEGKYWLEKIVAYCRAREWPCLVVPVPYAPGMLGQRRTGYYPGLISNALEINGLSLLDPADRFIDAHLEMVIDGIRKGRRPMGCPLFNDAIGDGHFSAAGSKVWAESVGRRVLLMLEEDRERRRRREPPRQESDNPASRDAAPEDKAGAGRRR